MASIKRGTSRTQVNAEIIAFPHPMKHKTVPCPVRPGGGLWQHGEQVPGTDRMYCRKCDVFFGPDHFCFTEGARP